ncbi:cytochrome c biogenesis protein CcdA [Lutimonas halocynthiae]|uniref:protein-disulfide reductase DsbD family protein n=1 Tax=Lutimonas halocynthiae TaxID=1446477 RepID=UPI0025B5E810|nr:thioredoxin family protein [Lutimonas halocynthiae]MDN3641479.1 cytochrome c biogenesis protein CcdA [Lutimonas halocynthiae]
MKFISKLFIFIFLIGSVTNAQIHNPVTWSTSVEKINDSEFNLLITAGIEAGWHLYSQDVPEGGPIPTTIKIPVDDSKYQLIGSVQEGKGHEEYDNVFDMDIKYFESQAVFKQKIRLLSSEKLTINGVLEFMVCDDTNCLPPTEVDLTFEVEGLGAEPLSDEALTSTENSFLQQSNIADESEDQAKTISHEKIVGETKKEKRKSLWTLFILSFFAGFAALLTPCVFPMIPMTVSFFTKQSKTRAIGIRNAILYGASIVILYVFLGTVVTYFFGADSLNALSTNVWFNLLFFLLLVVFAVSFLGAFEITLPSSWGTKVDSQADRGGLIGIFFMALALAIVSFSCTGPIVGTALVAAAAQGGTAPIISMLGFSLAIALPFSLFAAFPGWMNSLPKSGGWLNTVKVFLGFLELALAFKFLSNADLVLQGHWLEREVFIAIWITIFGALALYLFGKIKLPHDSDLPFISVGRLSLGLIVMSFTIYMIPGLWGAPLKLISGFPPPMHYSESSYGVGYTKLSDGGAGSTLEIPEDAHLGPHDIISFYDYDKGMAYAKKVNKPVMIDFTGHACVNCRKMEERVWSDSRVLQVLKNDIVLISLYVDDKRTLPEEEHYTSAINGKKVTTIGKKWSEFQINKYKANAQPYYVLIDLEGNNLNAYSAYNPDIDTYLAWLQEGIGNFKE